MRPSDDRDQKGVVYLVDGEMVAKFTIVEVRSGEYRVQGATWCPTAAANGFPAMSE